MTGNDITIHEADFAPLVLHSGNEDQPSSSPLSPIDHQAEREAYAELLRQLQNDEGDNAAIVAALTVEEFDEEAFAPQGDGGEREESKS